jgi:N-acetylmuramoyl-L-alanine amidase
MLLTVCSFYCYGKRRRGVVYKNGGGVMRYYYYERVLLALALVGTLFYSWKACAKQKPSAIHIEEIQHHCGGLSPTVEVGSCMFYCSELPKITLKHSTINENTEEYLFTLHNALLANEKSVRKAQDLNKSVTEPYTLSIQNVQDPTHRAVVVRITHPKGMFTVQHKPWEEQKNRNKKGLIFYVYNQTVIDLLRKKNEPVLRTVSLREHLPRVFIDSGHGGSDTGAVGIGNIQEKDVCLRVSIDLATMLRDAGYDVLVSRMTDCDVPLDERTSRANSTRADVFVSIHANASLNLVSHGIETFCLTPTLFTVANAQHNVFDRYGLKHVEQSKRLADYVQKSICYEASVFQKDLLNRGVKYTVSHLLVGATMPAILVEIGFVTNPDEARLLASREYQYALARGITRGIQAYCRFL